MQCIIQSPRINISDTTKNAILKKFNRFDHFYDRIKQCSIILKKEKNSKQENYIVEARLEIPHEDLFAREQCSSFEIAAEKVCLDLESQIKKRKGKLYERRGKSDQIMHNDESE